MAGVVDLDFTGNIGVLLINHGSEAFECHPGMRIAQLLIERIYYPEIAEVVSLDPSQRGDNGFGSSGTC